METTKITFNMNTELKNRLVEVGKKNSVTLTGMIHLAVEQYLDSEILRRQMVAEYNAKNKLGKDE